MIKDYNVTQIRADFPLLQEKVRGKNLIYLDNAATTQKPLSVINAVSDYYLKYNANVHRGVHYLSAKGTQMFEDTRKFVKNFINASDVSEIIFTRGTTESINLVASSFCEAFVGKGDEIIISEMEHHSNIVPFQLAGQRHGAVIKVLPFDEDGELMIDDRLEDLITEKTKLISVCHVSNSLGTINDIKKIINIAHKHNVSVLIDGAQAISHLKVDVRELDCDFYCFSGHKIYAPMGSGILYGKKSLLEKMPPYQGGGEMIKEVRFSGTTFNDLPYKFEAGTPSVADVAGLKAALEYVEHIGYENIEYYESQLTNYALEKLKTISGIRIIGNAKRRAGVISFLIDGYHPLDIGTLLDLFGVAIRTGHHCAQPVMEHYSIVGTCRLSIAMYNTFDEIDMFVESLCQAIKMLR
ncbi:MAG: cysteine desulfurase [Bacteroidales bacterium]|jgi:cysteine desulfurase/selenocysteine lyase|nr:cysteine desulfurase [Bacteroidales bacterium]